MPQIEHLTTWIVAHDGPIIQNIIQNHAIEAAALGEILLKLEKIGRYPLLNPIPFTTAYDRENEHWCLCNDELALFGYGSTHQNVIAALEDELESHIICYTEFSDEELAEDSLIIKEKLAQYVDFEKIKKILNEKYGDE